MKAALPAPRKPGMDSVRVGILIRQSKQPKNSGSGESQEQRSEASPRAQLDAALHHIQSPAHSAWHVSPDDVYADIGKSGWSDDVQRFAYDALMAKVRAGKIDVVIVFALSRLSRKGALDVLTTLDEFSKHGTRLVSITEPWLDTDPSNPVGQAILGLTAALAQQESEQKSAFITGAHAQARKRGGHVTGRAPYGLMVVRAVVDGVAVNKLVPDPEKMPVVRAMVRWAMVLKMDLRDIAVTLTEMAIPTPTGGKYWLVATVRSILRDPRLAGYSVEAFTRIQKDTDGKKRRRPISGSQAILYGPDGNLLSLHEGIITRAEWWELQLTQGSKANIPHSRKEKGVKEPVALFTRLKLVRCGVCGRPMQTNPGSGKNRYPFYTCNIGPGGPKGAGRHSMGITASQIDKLIPEMAFRRLRALDIEKPEDAKVLARVAERFARQNETEELRQQKSAAEQELEQIRGALTTLAADREAGDYKGPTMEKIYRDSNRRLVASESRLMKTLEELSEKESESVSLPSEWFEAGEDPIGPNSPWKEWDQVTRRSFLLTMVDEIRVAPVGFKGNHVPVEDRVEIDWTGGKVEVSA